MHFKKITLRIRVQQRAYATSQVKLSIFTKKFYFAEINRQNKSCPYSFSEFPKWRSGSSLTSVNERPVVKLHGDKWRFLPRGTRLLPSSGAHQLRQRLSTAVRLPERSTVGCDLSIQRYIPSTTLDSTGGCNTINLQVFCEFGIFFFFLLLWQQKRGKTPNVNSQNKTRSAHTSKLAVLMTYVCLKLHS